MSAAGDLIEQFERETGQRWDANNGDNTTMAGLFGMKSDHREYDDVVAGFVLRHRMTPEYEQEQESKRLLAEMLRSGLSPDDLAALFGK